MNYPRVARFRTVEEFLQHLEQLGQSLPCDDAILTAADESPLAKSMNFGEFVVGNRWCIHPMEGWDATRSGMPTELTLRRWRRFGLSGAKLIWGGEAVAVRADGRANPHQLIASEENIAGLISLRLELEAAHRESAGTLDSLLVGLQLTHSGRFCRPNSGRLEPRVAYHHPLLDAKFGIASNDDSVVWTDSDLETLVDDYVLAAGVAFEAGFRFVDIKACHGYLLHEFLSAHTRVGKYGGDLEGRTRLLTTIIQRIRDTYPQLMIGVRLSIFDGPPFAQADGRGRPVDHQSLLPYSYAFGADPVNPLEIDLSEPISLLKQLRACGVVAVNLSCGSPYYNPHLLRPALFPPSDGYRPPEDPLIGVARQIQTSRRCKTAVPELAMVGSGYSYLQEFLPHVAQAVVRAGWIDFVGLGRMVLSYPELPLDCLNTGSLARKRICRTFSDCTTAPRNGLVSGCYPLDEFFKSRPEAVLVKQLRQEME